MQNVFQFRRRLAGFDELIHVHERKSESRQFLFGFFLRRAFEFVNDLVKFVSLDGIVSGCWILDAGFKELLPCIAAAQADGKILFGQAKRAQRVNEQRDQFRVRRRIGFADDVGVKLKMFTQTAFLLTFVPEQLRERKPLDRFFVIAFVRGDHARKGRGHFRSQSYFAVTFVFEIVELADNFLSTFGRK